MGFLKGLLHGLAWSLATAAAVVLSWWGVHTVMAGTAYDPPRAVPITGGTPRDETPVSSSTPRPEPAAPTTPAPRPHPTTDGPPPLPPAPSSSHSAPPRAKPSRPPARPAPSAPAEDEDEVEDGVIRGYDTKGGRVVLDIGKTEAALVSATPRSGWSMKVTKSSHEIRVVFTTDGAGVSFVCEWHDGEQPQVEITDI